MKQIVIVLLIILLPSCGTKEIPDKMIGYSKKMGTTMFSNMSIFSKKGILIEDKGQKTVIHNLVTPFLLLVDTKDNNSPVQICSSTKKSILSQMSIGKKISDTKCFSRGSGYATREKTKNSYPIRLSDGNAHNYFSKNRTVNKSLSPATMFIYNILLRDGKSFKGKKFYMIIFVDKNSNGIIDEKEYELFDIFYNPEIKENFAIE